MTSNNVELYKKDWEQFRAFCEKKTKDKCFLNSKCWKRLKQWHFEKYCSRTERPFSLLFELKYLHKSYFSSIPGGSSLYYKYLKEREESY